MCLIYDINDNTIPISAKKIELASITFTKGCVI